MKAQRGLIGREFVNEIAVGIGECAELMLIGGVACGIDPDQTGRGRPDH